MIQLRHHLAPTRVSDMNKNKPSSANPRLKPLYPPNITDKEKLDMDELPGQIYRYGPFVILTDIFTRSTAVDASTNLSITYEGTLEDFLARLSALESFYNAPFDDAPDHVFYDALSHLIYNVQAMMQGEMLMEENMGDDYEDDFDADEWEDEWDDDEPPSNGFGFNTAPRQTDD